MQCLLCLRISIILTETYSETIFLNSPSIFEEYITADFMSAVELYKVCKDKFGNRAATAHFLEAQNATKVRVEVRGHNTTDQLQMADT